MLFPVYLSVALASLALAAPQEAQRPTITKTISKCTATTSLLPTTTCKPKTTITTTATIKKPRKTKTITVTADPVTTSCPIPSCPVAEPQLVNVVGFAGNRCGNDPVPQSGDLPNAELVSLTIPTNGDTTGSCENFENGQISSLMFTTIPDGLSLPRTCKLYSFFNRNCNDGAGSIQIDLSQAQRGLCQDPQFPATFVNINSVQIRC